MKKNFSHWHEFLQHRKVYNVSPKPPPDPVKAGSKRLGLRKSPTNWRYLPALSADRQAAGRKVIAEGDFLV
ncbi:MAG: hypothetical protein V2A64_05325 [Candidatus Omnitrophota bacterium]